ncbi:MAG: protein kinase [Acidobacteria bacterium]|nr:protein kinase [Acidobacteriota bacterium]
MANNEKRAEDTLIIVDASVTEASLAGDDLINQSNSLGEPTEPNLDNDSWEPVIGSIYDSKYKIEQKLGEGGMGVVYRANHIFIDRPVAIKFLRKEFLTDTAAISRFKLEARAAARIHHPNVTTILDFGVNEGAFYLVMEYLEGYSLRQQLKTNGALGIKDTIKIITQVCDALDAAHKSNIVHKDLKPDNIFLHIKEGIEQVKVLDFGIAEILGKASDLKDDTQSFAGTPHYMSPEQCQSDPVSPATDVYSLGIILFEMLTGQLPFDDVSAVKIVLKHLNNPPPKLTDFISTIPEGFNNIVIKALSKNPEKRYQSANLLLEDLQKAEKTNDENLIAVQDASASDPNLICSNPKCGQAGKTGNKRCPRCQALSTGSLLRHRYLIEKMVGRGGFGTTYLVKDLDCFDEYRILKELTLNLKDEDPGELKDMAERLFKREAQVLLNLYHSGIPRLYAYFAEDSFSYLVQDFIPGQTLSEELKKRKATISEQEALSILSSLADILDYLHSHNPPVIHRDIKPHNLMRHEDGRIMLIDFGAVCQSVANPQANNTVIGSLGYAPPEQFLGQTIPQSDLYALGASVIYLLTGIPPRLLLSINSSLSKLDFELEGKISTELLLLLKDLVSADTKDRLSNTKVLKNRLQSIINRASSSTINNLSNLNNTSANTNNVAIETPNNIASSPAPIELISKPISSNSTSTGSSRPSLSEAFAKMTGSMPNLTSQNQPNIGSKNNSQTFSKEPSLTNNSVPNTGQQPILTRNTLSPTNSPLLPDTNQRIAPKSGNPEVIQPLTTKPEPTSTNTPKQATPSLSQVLTNKNSFPTNQINHVNQFGQHNHNSNLKQPNSFTPSNSPSSFNSSRSTNLPNSLGLINSFNTNNSPRSISLPNLTNSPNQPSSTTKETPKQPAIDFQAVAHFSYEVESMLRLIDYGSYFAILGVNADASTQEILDAYRELSDKFQVNKYLHLSSFYPNLQNDLTKISTHLYEAFETLMDQNKRNLYKRSFRTGMFEQLKSPDKR